MAGTVGSDNELSEIDAPLSRDGSYFSLTSGNSVYLTAQGSLADLAESGAAGTAIPDKTPDAGGNENNLQVGSNKSTDRRQPPTLSPVQRCCIGSRPATAGSRSGSSSTLAEGDSLLSEEELAFLSPGSEDPQFRYNFLDDLSPGNSGRSSSEALDHLEMSSSATGLTEVKEDVSRICNALAEASHPDLQKQEEIETVLGMLGPGREMVTLKKLRFLAVSQDGLLSNALRKRAWAILLCIPQDNILAFETKKLPKKLEVVAEEVKNLVHLDVARVLKRFPPGLSDPQQDHLLSYLTTLICSVLEKNPGAYYYQGFHDISLTFLLVCISQSAPYLAYLCLNRMVESSLAPFMEVTMDATNDIIHVVYSIIEKEDPALYNQIVLKSKCPPAFCLPWVLTWFSHTLPNDSDVFRLYDFNLGCMEEVDPPCLIPVFTSAALILRNSTKILRTVTDTDIASMHQALSLLPSEQVNLEPWLMDSLKLMRKYSGSERELRRRAIQIKDIQFKLWTEDTNNNQRNNSSSGGRAGSGGRSPLMALGRFIFVRHRWVTVALFVVGAAVLIQSRYDVTSKWGWSLSKFMKYFPVRIQAILHSFVNELEFEVNEEQT